MAFLKQKLEDLTTSSLGNSKQFQWGLNKQQAATSTTNSFSALESDSFKSGNRSKEPYHSKGSLERDRGMSDSSSNGYSSRIFKSSGLLNEAISNCKPLDGPGSRSGSQHGSRDSSAARNSYSSRSLQMRPQTQGYVLNSLIAFNNHRTHMIPENETNRLICLSFQKL